MSKKAKSKKQNPMHAHNTPAPQPAPPTSEAQDPPTTSPNKLIAALFGIPFAVIVAAVTFRLLFN